MLNSADYIYQKQRREDERAEAAERIRQAQLLGEQQRRSSVFSTIGRALKSILGRAPRREPERQPEPQPRTRFTG